MNNNYLIRKLTHDDYEDVREICKDIWDGTDYLPDYFHRWVDEAGGFYGAIDKNTNKVVGVDKFSILFDQTGWLEGLRVHPSYQGQHLATMLTEHILDLAVRELDSGRVSRLAFSTHITAKQSISLMTSRKFVLKQKYALAMRNYEKNTPDLESARVERWAPTLSELQESDYLISREGILPLAFYFQELTPAYYEHLMEREAFVSINGHKGIQYFKGTECYFLVFDESPEGILAFSDWCWEKYKDRSKGFPLTCFSLPKDDLVGALKAVGFENWMDWEEDYLYFVYAP